MQQFMLHEWFNAFYLKFSTFILENCHKKIWSNIKVDFETFLGEEWFFYAYVRFTNSKTF